MSDGGARFCTACGSALQPSDAFCTACGVPAQAPPAPAQPSGAPPQAPVQPEPQTAAPAPSPVASGERPLAVIGNLTEIAGFLGTKSKTYSLIITDTRLIFAQLTKERMTAMVNAARDGAKADGKGFFGQWGAQLGTTMNYHQAYWEMSPDAALAETPGNFALHRRDVLDVKFRQGVSDENGATSNDRLILKTTAGKRTLQVGGSLSAVKKTFRETGLA